MLNNHLADYVLQYEALFASHFAFQLLDVLQHRLQTLMGVRDLRVVFGHVVLSQLLRLAEINAAGLIPKK